MSMRQSLVSLLKPAWAQTRPTPRHHLTWCLPGFWPRSSSRGRAYLLFTQRTFTVKDHRGQISFPGGVRHAGDPDLRATALRETQEEIGLDPQTVEVLGALTPVNTITGYCITPFVGLIPYPYDFQPSPLEVKRLLLLPLDGFYEAARWSSGDTATTGAPPGSATGAITGRYLGGHRPDSPEPSGPLGHNPIPGGHDATCWTDWPRPRPW